MTTMNAIKYVENWHDVLHADVIRILRDFYDLMDASDSTTDDFDRELMCILDPDVAELHAHWHDYETDVHRRNAQTEVAKYMAIRMYLSPFDMEVLHQIPDVWDVVENAANETQYRETMFGHLVAIADFIERNK